MASTVDRCGFRHCFIFQFLAAIVSNAVYWQLGTLTSAYGISVLAGAAYMTGTLIQLDLIARIIPPRAAATLFNCYGADRLYGSRLKHLVDGYLKPRNYKDETVSAPWSQSALPLRQAAGCWSPCSVAPHLNGGSRRGKISLTLKRGDASGGIRIWNKNLEGTISCRRRPS